MPSQTRCPRCANLPVLTETRAGKRGRCPACKNPLLLVQGSGAIYRFKELEFSLTGKYRISAAVTAALLMLVIFVRLISTGPIISAEPLGGAAENSPPAEVPQPYAMPSGSAKAAPNIANTKAAAHAGPAQDSLSSAKPYSWNVAKQSPGYDDDHVPQVKPNLSQSIVAERKDFNEIWGAVSEKELLAQLRKVQRLDLDAEFQKELLDKSKPRSGRKTSPIPAAPIMQSFATSAYLREVKEHRPGLPYIEGDECLWPAHTAIDLVNRSLVIRRGLARLPNEPELKKSDSSGQARVFVTCLSWADGAREVRGSWQEKDAVVPLQQILMAEEDPAMRGVLIGCLAKIPGKTATVALARRALFDQNACNRRDAVEALRDRAPEDYAPVLLQGLRYPWPVVSDHASRALAALERTDVVPELVQCLEEPDPDLPYAEGGRHKVRELVRINHHCNCLLCHPPSLSNDEVRGLVPSPLLPLPDARLGKPYYGGETGPFVRGDITFLRQDFSVLQEVANPAPWPAQQRFDFFVRVRELTQAQAAFYRNQRGTAPSEHKKAIVRALEGLTGTSGGTSAAWWRDKLRMPAVASGS